MDRLRQFRPSPALVVAALALFVALGTGAYAVTTLKSGQVKTKHLAKNAVTGKKAKESSFAKVPAAKNADALEGVEVVAQVDVTGPGTLGTNGCALRTLSASGATGDDIAVADPPSGWDTATMSFVPITGTNSAGFRVCNFGGSFDFSGTTTVLVLRAP